jgi:dihydroorotate dehydrogenase (NAD+) catalytic subunit
VTDPAALDEASLRAALAEAYGIVAVDLAIEDAGADAISAVNTLSGMAIDRGARRPLLGNTYGGLSGPALKPVALRVVYEVAQVIDIPIVAIGGVSSLEDVLDFLMAGASAVQVGTAVFADPVLPLRLIDELEGWCRDQRLGSHRELIGAALPSKRGRPSIKGVEYRP